MLSPMPRNQLKDELGKPERKSYSSEHLKCEVILGFILPMLVGFAKAFDTEGYFVNSVSFGFISS